MNYEEKIILIATKQFGYIKSKDLLKYNIPRIYLSILMKKNIIRKLNRGIYLLSSYVEDDFYVLHLKYSLIRYSRATLLFLHNLLNRSLVNYTANVPINYSVNNINEITCYRTTKSLYEVGFSMVETPQGMKVPSYNIERCICELFLFSNDFDVEEKKYALNEAKKRKLDPDTLLEYASILGIKKEIKIFLELI